MSLTKMKLNKVCDGYHNKAFGLVDRDTLNLLAFAKARAAKSYRFKPNKIAIGQQ